MFNLKDYGAVGDGVANDTAAVKAWIADMLSSNAIGGVTTGYVPSGVYMVLEGPTGVGITTSFDITPTSPTITAIALIGDGASSIFRRRPNTVGTGNMSAQMFDITNATGYPLDVTIKGLTFDDQADGTNQPPIDPANRFDYQHSSTVRLVPQDTLSILNVHLEDLIFMRPLADGVLFGGGTDQSFGSINIVNVEERDREAGRPRSGICVTASYDSFNISNFNLTSLQTEPNSIEAGRLFETNISNGTVQGGFSGFDLSLKSADNAGLRATCNISNVVAVGRINLLNYDFNVVNCDLRTSTTIRTVWGRYKFENCRIGTSDSDFDYDNSSLISNTSTSAYGLHFQNVTFHNDGGITGADLLTVYGHHNEDADATQEGVVFADCDFAVTTMFAAYLRAGDFSFLRCTHRYDGTSVPSNALIAGNTVTSGKASICHKTPSTNIHYKRISLVDNFIDNATAYLYTPPIDVDNTDPVTVYCDNPRVQPGFSIYWTRYDEIAPPYGSGNVVSLCQLDAWTEGVTTTLSGPYPTTGRWVRGQKLYYADPTARGFLGCVCSVSGNADGSSATGANSGATFEMFGKLEPGGGCVVEDDFLGPHLDDNRWTSAKGANAGCVEFQVLQPAAGGVVRGTTGTGSSSTMADGVQLSGARNWQGQLGVGMEVSLKIDSNTNVALYVGLTDQTSDLDIPVTKDSGGLHTTITDGCGFLVDTASGSSTIWFVGVNGGTALAAVNSSKTFSANTYFKLRIDVASNGDATFRINGKVYTPMTGAVAPTATLKPVVSAFSRSSSSRNIDVDYAILHEKR